MECPSYVAAARRAHRTGCTLTLCLSLVTDGQRRGPSRGRGDQRAAGGRPGPIFRPAGQRGGAGEDRCGSLRASADKVPGTRGAGAVRARFPESARALARCPPPPTHRSKWAEAAGHVPGLCAGAQAPGVGGERPRAAWDVMTHVSGTQAPGVPGPVGSLACEAGLTLRRG